LSKRQLGLTAEPRGGAQPVAGMRPLEIRWFGHVAG
jgi:hypothetical protein